MTNQREAIFTYATNSVVRDPETGFYGHFAVATTVTNGPEASRTLALVDTADDAAVVTLALALTYRARPLVMQSVFSLLSPVLTDLVRRQKAM